MSALGQLPDVAPVVLDLRDPGVAQMCPSVVIADPTVRLRWEVTNAPLGMQVWAVEPEPGMAGVHWAVLLTSGRPTRAVVVQGFVRAQRVTIDHLARMPHVQELLKVRRGEDPARTAVRMTAGWERVQALIKAISDPEAFWEDTPAADREPTVLLAAVAEAYPTAAEHRAWVAVCTTAKVNPAQARFWRERDFSVDEAAAWLAVPNGSSPMHPIEADAFRARGLGVDVATAMAAAGDRPRAKYAANWTAAGFTPSDITAYLRAGLDLGAAQQHRASGGPMSDVEVMAALRRPPT